MIINSYEFFTFLSKPSIDKYAQRLFEFQIAWHYDSYFGQTTTSVAFEW